MRICSFQEVAHRLGDVLEDTPAPSLALVGHQLHAVPPLLLRLLGEVGGKPRQRLVVSREVGRLEVEMRCKVTLTLTLTLTYPMRAIWATISLFKKCRNQKVLKAIWVPPPHTI